MFRIVGRASHLSCLSRFTHSVQSRRARHFLLPAVAMKTSFPSATEGKSRANIWRFGLVRPSLRPATSWKQGGHRRGAGSQTKRQPTWLCRRWHTLRGFVGVTWLGKEVGQVGQRLLPISLATVSEVGALWALRIRDCGRLASKLSARGAINGWNTGLFVGMRLLYDRIFPAQLT